VSLWLDELDRTRLTSGSPQRLVAQRHVVGMTTNPTIFTKAMTSSDQTDAIQALVRSRVQMDPSVLIDSSVPLTELAPGAPAQSGTRRDRLDAAIAERRRRPVYPGGAPVGVLAGCRR